MRKYQAGFTLIELLICIAGVAVVGVVVGTFIYVAIHFISKFW